MASSRLCLHVNYCWNSFSLIYGRDILCWSCLLSREGRVAAAVMTSMKLITLSQISLLFSIYIISSFSRRQRHNQSLCIALCWCKTHFLNDLKQSKIMARYFDKSLHGVRHFKAVGLYWNLCWNCSWNCYIILQTYLFIHCGSWIFRTNPWLNFIATVIIVILRNMTPVM